jgi:hypothetical protein
LLDGTVPEAGDERLDGVSIRQDSKSYLLIKNERPAKAS